MDGVTGSSGSGQWAAAGRVLAVDVLSESDGSAVRLLVGETIPESDDLRLENSASDGCGRPCAPVSSMGRSFVDGGLMIEDSVVSQSAVVVVISS
jgi:hypothetical protein